MRRKPASASSASVPTLTKQGLHHMTAGRWRDAIQTYKKLVKQDPSGGWEAQLWEVYGKRAEELAGKNMFKESLILLDNADNLAITRKHTLLRITCLLALNNVEQAVMVYIHEETLIKEAHADLFPVLREHMAAILLTDQSMEQVLPADSPWRVQLTIAHEALTAFCNPTNNTDLEPLLGRISIRSPFKPLRLILKALVLEKDQTDKALQLVASIATTSAWAGMARLVVLCTMEERELLRRWDEFTQKELEIALGWRGGISAETSHTIQKLLTAAPKQQISILLDPTAHWSKAKTATLRRTAFSLLVESPGDLPSFEKRFGVLDAAEKSRLAALTKSRVHPSQALREWQLYLRRLQAIPATTERNLRLAMTHLFVAALILDEEGDEAEAITHLEQSLKYDAAHRKTHQALLAYHKSKENSKACRQVLERALLQFPDDADFIHEAVRQALQNKTFKKASRLAKRLLTIDPLHADVRRDLIGACLAQARKQVQGGRVDLAEKELAEASTWERAEEKDGVVRINKAFLAWLAKRQEEGDALLEEGIREAGGGVPARLRAAMEGVRIGLPPPIKMRLKNDLMVGASLPVTHDEVITFVRVSWNYADEKTALRNMLTGMSGFWAQAKKPSYTPEEFRSICRVLVVTDMFGVLAQYAKIGENKWRDQPVFVYYRLYAKYKGDMIDVSSVDYNKLVTVLQKAKELKDNALVQAIEKCLFEAEDYYDDDDDDDDDDLFGDDDFMPQFLPRSGAVPRGMGQEMVMSMVIMAANMFKDSQRHSVTREEMRQFLIAFFDDAPMDLDELIEDRQTFLETVLERLFSSPSGRLPNSPPSGKKMPSRGRGRGRGRCNCGYCNG